MKYYTLTIHHEGKITLPVKYRKKMGLKKGDKVLARIQGNKLLITSLEISLQQQ